MASCEQGEYVKGELKKKRNTMIKPNRVFKKKRHIKKGVTEEKTIKNENLKRRMLKNT